MAKSKIEKVLAEEKKEVVLEKKILSEVEKIENMEHQIKKSEEKITKDFAAGVKTLAKDGISVGEAGLIRRTVLRKISKHKFIFTLITTIGIVLVWRGLWDVTSVMPVLENSTVSLLIGFAILWLVEKYTEL